MEAWGRPGWEGGGGREPSRVEAGCRHAQAGQRRRSARGRPNVRWVRAGMLRRARADSLAKVRGCGRVEDGLSAILLADVVKEALELAVLVGRVEDVGHDEIA